MCPQQMLNSRRQSLVAASGSLGSKIGRSNLPPGWTPGRAVVIRDDPRTAHICNLACTIVKASLNTFTGMHRVYLCCTGSRSVDWLAAGRCQLFYCAQEGGHSGSCSCLGWTPECLFRISCSHTAVCRLAGSGELSCRDAQMQAAAVPNVEVCASLKDVCLQVQVPIVMVLTHEGGRTVVGSAKGLQAMEKLWLSEFCEWLSRHEHPEPLVIEDTLDDCRRVLSSL